MLAATPAFAGKPSSSVELTIVGSICSKTFSWAGANVTPSYHGNLWPRGNVTFCATKYRMKDADPTGDYYMIYVVADYSFTGGLQRDMEAPGNINIGSSRAAVSNSWSATKGYTGKKKCSALSVGVSAGPFEVDVTPLMCKGFKVERTSAGSAGATYKAAKVGGAERMEAVFYQKVANGKKPVFTVDFWRPTYKHVRAGVNSPYIETKSMSKWTYYG